MGNLNHALDFTKSALYFILVLSTLVIVHEWGHFIVAKLCKMRVEDFSLFFGKKLIRLGSRNGTEYNIRCIPLGGFVKIAGMEPDDISNGAPLLKRNSTARETPQAVRGLDEEALSAVNPEKISDHIHSAVHGAVDGEGRVTQDGREELNALLNTVSLNADETQYIRLVLDAVQTPPSPDMFNQKPLWQRALVIFAGPFMSLFFGYILFCLMGFSPWGLPVPGEERVEPVVQNVLKGRPAEKAGLIAGDRIVQLNGVAISDTDGKSMIEVIHNSAGKPLHLIVKRTVKGNTVQLPYTAVPELGEVETVKNGHTMKIKVGLLGFTPKIDMVWRHYSALGSIKAGSSIIALSVQMTFRGIFSKDVGKNVGGPLAISNTIDQARRDGPKQVALTAALLSVSLGLVNLFPIPILDGGHLVLLGVEGLRRRKLSTREVYTAQMVGLSIIGVLFVLVMYNDIVRIYLHRG